MSTYKNRPIQRDEIINKIKKYFPQFKLNVDETILNVYDKQIKIPNFNPTDTFFGIYEGIELLSMIVEHILWYKNAYENNLNLEKDLSEIIEISRKELDLLIEKGIYDDSI